MTFIRFLKILFIFHRYNLYRLLKTSKKTSLLFIIVRLVFFFIPYKYKHLSLANRTRLAFETLGPVFIKFGQLLSTRPDIISNDFIEELSKLQNQVPPFCGEIAINIIEKSLKNKINHFFEDFSKNAVASASIAQVHSAKLKKTYEKVAIKVLRPNIKKIIKNDIRLLKFIAIFIELFFSDGKLLKPKEVIKEFEKIIYAELDFLAEAANATELYRLHQNDKKIKIPKIFYDYCTSEVIVLEWVDGTPISDIVTLKSKGINLEQLSNNGVAIFYTQVFDFGFFHADMHPGNILCDDNGRYIALDFGIVGCLSEEDKRYLAINILAFFNRDYKKVAITHVESGWAPLNTSIEELENAIRTVCEPIFNKPISQISFGQVLIRLLQVSRKFNISIQPQLILLQKTIINVEGLGRMLNPNLDLWISAKPILEKWMRKQMGLRGFINNIKAELPYLSYSLPILPRIIMKSLQETKKNNNDKLLSEIKSLKFLNFSLLCIIIILLLHHYN